MAKLHLKIPIILSFMQFNMDLYGFYAILFDMCIITDEQIWICWCCKRSVVVLMRLPDLKREADLKKCRKNWYSLGNKLWCQVTGTRWWFFFFWHKTTWRVSLILLLSLLIRCTHRVYLGSLDLFQVCYMCDSVKCHYA